MSLSMKIKLILFKLTGFFLILINLNSCGIYRPVSAKDYPPEPEKRVQKNLQEGRGFTIMGAMNKKGGGNFNFATSNEMWRASLDILDFMPLTSADYGGGLIITDWYSDGSNTNDSVKISIRFLSNEIRADALDIKVFYKKCELNENCVISEKSGKLVAELNKKILQKATIYEKQNKDKNFKPYKYPEGNN